MPVFLVTPLIENAQQIATAVKGQFAEADRFELARPSGGWLVHYVGTTVSLSHQLGISSEAPGFVSPVGPALVTLVGSYYGRGNPHMWEWLSFQFGRGT